MRFIPYYATQNKHWYKRYTLGQERRISFAFLKFRLIIAY